MPEISTAAKKAGRIFFDAMNGTNPNYDICEIVQQAIDDATAEKDAEINRLLNALQTISNICGEASAFATKKPRTRKENQ